jgi:SAM-dependent MidA family methyltransferase
LGQFAAQRRALITILLEAGVTDWEARLTELRKTPQYESIVLRYKTLLKQAEVGVDFEALAQLMQELNEGKPPN